VEEVMKEELSTLLAHETDDAVPGDHERRIREGLGALLAAAPIAAPSPASPTSPPSPSPSIAAGAKATAATLKVTTAALLGLGLTAGGFALGRATAPSPPPPAPAQPASTQPASVAPALSPAPAPAPAPASAAPIASPPLSSPAISPPPSAPSTSAFDREASLLERARAALVRHDPAAAESALAAFDKQFPTSRHAEERDYLRIQLLRELGDAAAVRERARAFLAAHPDSLFRARVEPLAQ
jgi:hypothetical protein